MLKWTGCLAMGLVIAFLLPAAMSGAQPMPSEQLNHDWLVRWLDRPIDKGARSQRYLNFINASLDETYCGVDVNFLENGKGDLSRPQTNALARLAFCYRTPGVKYFHDPKALELLKRGYVAAAKHVEPDGRFHWAGDVGYWYEAHEQAWRLEAFLIGYIWAGENFSPDEKKVVEAALLRATEWQIANPLLQNNNRGMVCCAVGQLCALYYDRPDWQKLMRDRVDPIFHTIVRPDGEVGERTEQYAGGGPDSNYSYTSISHVLFYRAISGRTDLDEDIRRAAKWFALFNTRSGYPLCPGASCRKGGVDMFVMQDILPLLERYSSEDRFFAQVADLHLRKKEMFGPPFGPAIVGNHDVHPMIWAMEDAAATPVSTTDALPDWAINHTQMYDRPAIQYSLIGRQYQTGVTSRGRTESGYEFKLRGMQTFAGGNEMPILMALDDLASTTRAGEADTSTQNVDKAPAGWESILQQGPMIAKSRSNLATLVERRKGLWTLYAFTPVSTVVVYGGVAGIESRWVMNSRTVPEPVLNEKEHVITFKDLTSRIVYLDGKAQIDHVKDAATLNVSTKAATNAFAFAMGKFQFASAEGKPNEIRFTDSSGVYQISLNNMVDTQGNLQRDASFRLTLLQ